MSEDVVLVTGAASGIGYETARQFLEHGAVVVGTDRNAAGLDAAAGRLGKRFVGRTMDVTKVAEIESLASFIGQTYGRLDTLVNNAGVARFISITDMQESDYLYHYEVLVKGPMFVAKHCIPLLRKSDSPSIVNISSVAARNEVDNHHLYSTAKAAIEKFTYHLVRDYPGIRSNTILPGFIDTAIYRSTGLTDEQIKQIFAQAAKAIPCNRVGTPEDIANCVRFLSSKQASYINGAAIVIDGGLLQSGKWGI